MIHGEQKSPRKGKRKLHYAMVRCSRVKRAVHESLNPHKRETMQIWNHDHHPFQLVAEPTAVGQGFSKCLTSLGKDSSFTVEEDTLNAHLARFRECPQRNSSKSLPSPHQEWFLCTITAANPAKATCGLNLPPCHSAAVFTCNYTCGAQRASKKMVSLAGMSRLQREEPQGSGKLPPDLPDQYDKSVAAWLCKHLTHGVQQHSLLHPCQHDGPANHCCGDHIYDVVAGMLQSKGRLYHLYIDFHKAFTSVPLKAL